MTAITISVGYVGLGTMGRPMATNLAKAGVDLVVYDVRPQPCADLEALGASIAATPAEAAEGRQVVLVNVVNDAQARQVILGADGVAGVLATARPGSVVAVHSTITPSTCRDLAEQSGRRGVGFVDAPVSGGVFGAEQGALTIMVGGDTAHVEACRPAFEIMASTIFHVGAVGMGEAAKITNNLVLAIVQQATTEGLGLARRAGIDEDTMLSILCASAGDSWVSRNWKAIGQITEAYPGGAQGMADLIYKDLSIALAIGHDVRAPLPVAALTAQLVGVPYRYPDDDHPPQPTPRETKVT